MASADNAVLTLFEGAILNAEVIDCVVSVLVKRLTTPRPSLEPQKASLRRVISAAESERDRFVAAIGAGGGDVPALVNALRENTAKLDGLRGQLGALLRPQIADVADPLAITQAVHQRLIDWRGLLRANTDEARRLFAKLVDGRLVFTRRREGQREFYEFTGTGTVSAILQGIVDVPVTTDGVPTGIRRSVERPAVGRDASGCLTSDAFGSTKMGDCLLGITGIEPS